MPSIDQRIVEMQFNNRQFESGVQKTIGTLANLKASLSNIGSSMSIANSAMQKINKLDLSGIQNGIEELQYRFSVAGIAGATFVSNLTTSVMQLGGRILSYVNAPISQAMSLIKEGGKQRALNVEQAKFQMEGLGLAFKDFNDQINKAVSGTRFGYDEAAMAASQLAASGIKAGEGVGEMGHALLAISGVAAMTNSEYSDMANIFTTVASNGKLMTENIRSFSARGLNITAEMAKQWGTTEQNVQDMVSKGKVSFEMFSEAMYNAFAAQATKADKMFTGVIANIRAAFKKIGQDFWTPIVENDSPIVHGLQAFKDLINKTVRPTIQKLFVGDWTNFTKKFGKSMEDFFRNEHLIKSIENFLKSIGNAFEFVKSVIAPFRRIFESMFPSITIEKIAQVSENIQNLTSKYKDFAKTLSDKKFVSTWIKTKDFTSIFGGDLGGGEKTADALENLWDKFEKAKNVFKGVLAVFDIVKQFASAIFRTISPLTETLSLFGDGILNISSGFSEYIVSLRDAIVESDFFYKVFQKIIDFFSPVIDKVKEWTYKINGYLEEFSKNVLGPVGEKILEFIRNFGDTTSEASDKVNPFIVIFEKLSGALSGFYNFVSGVYGKVSGFVGNLVDKVRNLTDKVKEASPVIQDSIANAFNGLKSSLSIFSAVQAGSFMAFFIYLKDGFKKIKTAITGTNLDKIGSKIVGALNDIRDTLQAYQDNLRASELIKIAGAVAILAGSIWLLSTIDPASLAFSVSAISTAFVELMGAMKFLGTLDSGTSKSKNFFGIYSESEGPEDLSEQLIKISVALLLLAGALKLISTIDPDKLWQGLIAIGVLLTELGIFVKKSQLDKNSKTAGMSLVFLAIALNIMAGAVKKLGALEPEALGRGLVSIALLLSAIAVFIKYITKNKGSLKGLTSAGAGIILLAIGLNIIAKAVASLGNLDPEALARGIISIGFLMFELMVMLRLMPKEMMSKSAGLFIVSSAIVVLTAAIALLSGLDAERMAAAILVLGGALIELVVALNLMKGTVLASVSLTIAAAGIMVLTTSLLALSLLKPEQIVKSLLALGGALTIIIAAGYLAKGAVVGIFALGWAIASMGFGILNIGLGLISIAAGITSFANAVADNAPKIVIAFGVIAAAIGAAIPIIATALAVGIIKFVKVLANGADEIAVAIAELLLHILQEVNKILPAVGETLKILFQMLIMGIAHFLDGLITLIPKVKELVMTLLKAFVDTIVEGIPLIVGAALDIVTSFLFELANHMEEIVYQAIMIVVNFVNGIAQGLPEVIQAAFNLVISFIHGLADGIRNNYNEVILALGDLLAALLQAALGAVGSFIGVGGELIGGLAEGLLDMVDNAVGAIAKVIGDVLAKVGEFIGDFFNAGKDIINGITNGISSAVEGAKNAVGDVCSTIWGKVTSFFDVHSPSRKMHWVGEMLDQGLANGLSDFSHVTAKAADGMANNTMDSMMRTFGAIQDVVNDNIDLTPTITPVLDASEIQNGSRLLDGYFGTRRSLALASATGGSFTSNNRSMTGTFREMLDNATSTIAGKMEYGDSSLTVEVPLYLDSREVGHATAPVVNADIERMQRNAMRRAGKR